MSTIHGLVVDAPFVLPAARSRPADPVDVRIDVEVVGAVPSQDEIDVLVDVDDARAGRRYRLSAAGKGWEFLFRDTVTVLIDASLGHARLFLHSSERLEVLPTLVAGPLLTAMAMLRGVDVIHASAVVGGTRAMAFAGPSGAGKSTLAALLAGDNFQLFSDDALAFALTGPRVTAYRGTTRSRMRSERTLSREPAGRSPDGRFIYEQQRSNSPDRAELVAVMLPLLSSRFDQLRLERISGARAVLPLASAAALDGIVSLDLLRRNFETASALVQRVPVYELEVPWGAGGSVEGLRDELRQRISDMAGAPPQ